LQYLAPFGLPDRERWSDLILRIAEHLTQWFLIGARVLLAVIFLLNGFGIINQAIPAKEMIERGVPLGIVSFAMFAGRFLEIVAGFNSRF